MLDAPSRSVAVLAVLQTPRTQHAATLLQDGRVLVTGGAGQQGLLDSTEFYDPRTNSFSQGPRLKVPRAGHTSTVLEDGRVLIAGGAADGSAAEGGGGRVGRGDIVGGRQGLAGGRSEDRRP